MTCIKQENIKILDKFYSLFNNNIQQVVRYLKDNNINTDTKNITTIIKDAKTIKQNIEVNLLHSQSCEWNLYLNKELKYYLNNYTTILNHIKFNNCKYDQIIVDILEAIEKMFPNMKTYFQLQFDKYVNNLVLQKNLCESENTKFLSKIEQKYSNLINSLNYK